MYNLIRFGIPVAIAAMFLWSFAGNPEPSTASQADSTFARMAYMANCAEISAGNLALQKARDPRVAEFGKTMVADHTQANSELLAITGTPPSTDSLDAEHRVLQDSLLAAEGTAFDALYVRNRVRDHHKSIALFERQAKNGKDQKLKAYAKKSLPKLQMHLDHVLQITDKETAGGQHSGH